MILKSVYIVFIGVLLATFIGVGIAAFYPSPKIPESSKPIYPYEINREATPSAEYIKKQEVESQKWRDHQEKVETYNKNVSIISAVASILILIVSLILFKQLLLIADGLLLGGVLVLLYSIVRGFGANDDMFRFGVVTIGLMVALFLGYIKLIKSSPFTN
ncbi:MAG: hypothetical protein Q7S88_01245 [Candidatus Daviesbacteria bacterium]|nr:hypothetical protein [Candidatus Daviesbacteria bacterium]